MPSFIHDGFYFVIVISIVVIIHEFGHFLLARLCGVRVEAFSLFFGRAILKFKRGDTEWRLGVIPIGGYVKMLGQSDLDAVDTEDIDEDIRGASFAHKPLWAKALIVAAGPASNLLLAFVIFSLLFFAGYPTPTTLLGSVDKDGAAWAAGIRPGDRIVAIDGEEVWRWDDMAEIISDNPETPMTFSVERGQDRLETSVTPRMSRVKNIFQFDADAGVIGVSLDGYLPIAGVSDPAGPAAAAGLRTGDLIKKVSGVEIHYFSDVERVLSGSEGPIEIVIERGGLALEEQERDPQEMSFVLTSPVPVNTPADIGLERGDLYIHQVVEDNPAQMAGLLNGDRLFKINGQVLKDWRAFTEWARSNPGKELSVSVLREGREMNFAVTPKPVMEKDMLGEEEEIGRVGIYPWLSFSMPEIKKEKYLNPLTAFSRGMETSVKWTVLTIKGFFFLFTGDVSLKTLGGPIMIANLAGKSASGGFFSFFMFVAIISLNLAIINFLPIPVLDGGHLMIFGIEGIIRRPISAAGMQFVMKIGLFIVGILVVATFYNDISRLVFPGLRSLFGL
jgi:regulator of sigma E protease